jgi:hypothetical protein
VGKKFVGEHVGNGTVWCPSIERRDFLRQDLHLHWPEQEVTLAFTTGEVSYF